MATRPPERLWFDDFYVVAVDLGVNVSDLFLDVVERRRLVIGDNCETGQKERIPRRYFVDRPRSMVVPPYRIDLRKAVLFVGERPRWKNIKVQGAILQSIPEWEDNPHDPRDNFASDSIACYEAQLLRVSTSLLTECLLIKGVRGRDTESPPRPIFIAMGWG